MRYVWEYALAIGVLGVVMYMYNNNNKMNEYIIALFFIE